MITILKIFSQNDVFCEALVGFAGESLQTIVFAKPEEQKEGMELSVETTFSKVLEAKIHSNYSDADAYIRQEGENFRILGKLYQVLPLQEDCIVNISLIQDRLYISCMLSDLQGANPPLGVGVELLLERLRFYSRGI